MSSLICPVVLCGGSGTRLWPLSRQSFPKQFVPLIEDKNLLQLTLERVRPLSPKVTCIANNEYRFLVQEAMEQAGVSGGQLLEPEGRNTAAAMTCAALNSKPEDYLLFLPADHYIPETDRFVETVKQGLAAAGAGYLVTFGVQPFYPSTAYGYIQTGQPLADAAPACTVARFVEKPGQKQAEQLLATGGHLWNAGIFLIKSDVLLSAVELHAPDIFAACKAAVAKQTLDGNFTRLDQETFLKCRSESIDYAVLEHHNRVAVVPFPGKWSDVGSWSAVADLIPADGQGNRISGHGSVVRAANTYINAPCHPVVALGTQNLHIIDTPDALLVADAKYVEQVKEVVAMLNGQNAPEAVSHRRVARPWGSYDSIDKGPNFQVKRIVVKPGAKLSLQLHNHRAEHWVVVKGVAKVTNGDQVFTLHENESTYIPIGARHRLENPGDSPLEIIEVQTGQYLGEDDIVRLEDNYGRAST